MTRNYRTGRLAAALLWAGAVTIAQQPPQTAPTGPQLLHPMSGLPAGPFEVVVR